MVETEWAFLLDRLTFRLSVDFGRQVEMLLENPALSTCEVIVLEAGSEVDILLVFEKTVVIEKRETVEIPVVVYHVLC